MRRYTLEEVRSIRDKISKLGERKIESEAERDRIEAEYEKAEERYEKAEKKFKKAEKKFKKAEKKFKKAEAELDKIEAECDKARAERDRLGAECDKAGAEYDKAEAEWDIKLFDILISICPEGHYRDWRGYIAIPKSKKDDWIVPVFSGDYRGVKHKAFSIWTIPKDNCDEREAREVKDE
ncbi:MAG: Chromosome partition protein Smc [candidate division WS2 bacterium]|nr:Chromosome partition protein Smc [Candidatus Lithacetigena glycinireducens]